jgi:hypothetical protein
VDSFRYTYRSLPASGQIVARVASIENTDANAKVGVMIRGSTSATAAYMGVFVTPGAGIVLQTRSATGGSTTVTAGPTTAAAPYWVKVVRSGNSLSGFYSSDGVTWTQVGATLALNLGSGAYIGLASTSKSTTLLSTASVTNVTTNVAPTILQPATASVVGNDNTATLSVRAADDGGTAALTYTWSVTSQPPGAATPTFSNNSNNAASNTLVQFFAGGSYQFMVTISDNAGLSVVSTVVVNVTLAVAPTVATPASAGDVSAGLNVDLSVLGADDQGEASLTYTWSTVTQPDGVTPPTFSVNGTNAARDTTAQFSQGGDYLLRVTITDASGLSVTSDVAVSVPAPVPPQVTAITFDYRNHLSVTFSEDVLKSLDTGDLSVSPAGGKAALAPSSFAWDADTRTATFEFAAGFGNGDYQAKLLATGVSDGNGLHPVADGVLDFFVLGGDVNRDRSVDFNDLVILAQNYNTSGQTYGQGDLTGDGSVDFNDLVLIAQSYNSALPPVTAPPALAEAPVIDPVMPTTAFSTQRIRETPQAGDVLQRVNKPKPAAVKHRIGR